MTACFCMYSVDYVLQQGDIVFGTHFSGLTVPYRCLYLADVHLVQEKHTKAALADAAAYCQRQLVFEQHFVEGQACAMLTAGERELLFE